MTLTPNFVAAMGSLLILILAFFMGTNGLSFAAISMTILVVFLGLWLAVRLAIRCLAYRIATQLEGASRFSKGASNE